MPADTYKQTGLRQQGFTILALSKRQIIILIVMVITILYGGYTLLPILSDKIVHNLKVGKEEDVKTFMGNIITDLTKSNLTITEAYLINRAESEWQKDPFRLMGISETMSTTGGAVKVNGAPSGHFIYKGFVETRNKKMAIINGIEYGIGDTLEKEGFVLESILQNKVIIRDKKKNITQEIPLKKSGEDLP